MADRGPDHTPPAWLVVMALPVLVTAPVVACLVEPLARELGLARSWWPRKRP